MAISLTVSASKLPLNIVPYPFSNIKAISSTVKSGC
jgi:hypothetical protein